MNQATEKDNRDQQIGRSIAAAIQQQGKPVACLSDEQLASLLDNRIPAGERERCFAHIADCDSCLARYSMAASLLKETPQHAQTTTSVRGFLYGSMAVAAVALLAIGLVLQQQPGKTNGQVQTAEHSAIGGINTSSAETSRLHQRLKT